MAQVLKDEIREKILAAALDEFFDRGYKLAAMRDIAAKAQIRMLAKPLCPSERIYHPDRQERRHKV